MASLRDLVAGTAASNITVAVPSYLTKTANYTATYVGDEVIFCNVAGGAFTLTLPAGVAGNVINFAVSADADTNNLTVAPDGSETIEGVTGNLVVDIAYFTSSLVYIDSVWRIT